MKFLSSQPKKQAMNQCFRDMKLKFQDIDLLFKVGHLFFQDINLKVQDVIIIIQAGNLLSFFVKISN